MSNMVLQASAGSDYKPHPEGIHPAICVDVIDLGLQETEFQGQKRMTPKLKLVFESEQKLEDGRNCTISKNFTASLNPKAKLAEFLGKWRGRPVVPGETVDLSKVIGVSCTLVISHQQNMVGRTYASIDAVSKPTKKLVPSGHYDPAAARRRIEEWRTKQAGQGTQGTSMTQGTQVTGAPRAAAPAPAPAHQPAPVAAIPKSAAAPAAGPNTAYDPEVGF